MKIIEQVVNEAEQRLKDLILEQESIIAECLKPFPNREDFSSGLEYGNAYVKYIDEHSKGIYSSKNMGIAIQKKFDAESQLRDIADARFTLVKYF